MVPQARFLRTRYPEIDVPYELLEEQIQADEKFKKTNLFDPLIGNQLAVLMTHDAKVEKRRGLLAFPTGVVGNELSTFSKLFDQSPCNQPIRRISHLLEP